MEYVIVFIIGMVVGGLVKPLLWDKVLNPWLVKNGWRI